MQAAMVCNAKAGLIRRPTLAFAPKVQVRRCIVKTPARLAFCMNSYKMSRMCFKSTASGANARLQARSVSSFKVMAYKVTLKTPSGEQVIECADDTYILDAAEEAGE
jgi:hypothetical protein